MSQLSGGVLTILKFVSSLLADWIRRIGSPYREISTRWVTCLLAGATISAACRNRTDAAGWGGTIDTLPGGQLVVTNPERGMWGPGTEWQVVEEFRIGAPEGDGPEMLGQISALEEDIGGRIWALESAEQLFKVFGSDGRFIRTVGRKGGGPGEMHQVAGVVQAADGRMLVVDPQGARISVFDTAGTFVRSYPVSAGFAMYPWPGGLDTAGYFYNVAPRPGAAGFEAVLVRHDTAMVPLDTLFPPTWDQQEYFEHGSRSGSVRASVPFSPSMDWRLTRSGDFWFVLTGSYELFRRSARGDTVRKVTKAFQTVPVTTAEKDSAVARLGWFSNQGGKVDRSRIPDVKPAVRDLMVDGDGYLWVNATLADTGLQRRTFEIFDPEGRFLGQLRLPFDLLSYPEPVIRRDRIIGVTQDAGSVPYIVSARIHRPGM